ncbi:nuclear transport factor 2 family protein [Streptomyces sp. NBC_01497]|uniref:nuclear transport factor 2 family protein n=1 Tax=Streptomyces sp. NBC_01497 TaxID=2903885 RepID=UPI002E32AE0B|nr:nuclear transport factor 2 family protein [Streptomyces sp. NBC_01497]
MTDSAFRPIDAALLPDAVTAYLRAHQARDTAASLATFTPDAAVTDEGRTHEGITAIQSWLERAGSQYTYTTTLTGAYRADDAHYVADHRLEGDFPGGVADLHFRFTLRDGSIERLVIEP